MKLLIILFIVALYGCKESEKEPNNWTIRSVINGDTFYQLNRVPLTLSEATEIIKRSPSDRIQTIVPWSDAYEVWTKGTQPYLVDTVYIHDTIYRTKVMHINSANSVIIGGDSNSPINQN